MKQSRDILKQFWGYDKFRPLQEDIIASVLDGEDTLALLPTGGGKSICFQIPGLQLDGVCIVISPLIALMYDQVSALNKKGIKAVAINSTMTKRQIDIALDNAIFGDTKFLYISPERLKSKLFLVRLEKMKVNLIAIDEAHCISQWGYDFRPSYLNIADLKESKPKVPFLALTATATPPVVEDIQNQLQFKAHNVFKKSFERDNISYITIQTNNKLNRIIEFSKKLKGSGIIYCATRKSTKILCKHLIENGISANFYHGGLDQDQRKTKQDAWISNKTKIIVATNAFGMGIDKSDVRFVLHYDIPQSIEAYFQEAGRGGRDLKKARAILFYEPEDIIRLQEMIALKYPPIELIKSVYNALGNHFQLAIGSGKDEHYGLNISEFSDKYNLNIITVYNALKFLELGNFILLSESAYLPSQIKILVNNFELYQYQVKSKELNLIIQFIVRSHMGVFEEYVTVNEFIIAKKLKISQKVLIEQLLFLQKNNVIDYNQKFKGSRITYLTERLADTNFSIDPKFYKDRKEDALKKLDAILNFLENKICRSQYLLAYFGEQSTKTCGLCNVCLNIDDKLLGNENYVKIKTIIETELKQSNSASIEDLVVKNNTINRETILATIRWMTEHDLIFVSNDGKTIHN